MNLLLSCALLSAVVWSSWAHPQYIVPYTPQHHIVPYSPKPFFRYHSTAPLYAYGLPYLSASQGYQPRQGFVYDNVDDQGRFLGSFGGATLAKEGTATELKGSVHITQSLFIPNNQAVHSIIVDGGFKNNAVYLVWIGTTAQKSATIGSFLPTASTHTPANNGEILGAFKHTTGIIPTFKISAASRFHNIDGNGKSVANAMLVASPGQFDSAAVPNNPTIAATDMVKLSGTEICVYEFTDTSCNSPLTSTCTVARVGCGKIG